MKNSELMLVDLADFSSTTRFAAELEARVASLEAEYEELLGAL